MARGYTLGLFANMYPAFEGDYRGIFIGQMVRDLELRGITVKKAVKTTSSVAGYCPFFWQSLSLARDKDLDLMQAEYIPHSSLVPALVGRKDIPLVLKFHGDDARIYPFQNPLNRRITRSMLARAAHIITGSEEMKMILIGLGSPPDRISAIHTGVDTSFFSPHAQEEIRNLLGLPQKSTIFLFVGRLHPWKGIGEILDVARRSPQLKFFFIGPGSVPSHPENCTFLGTQIPEMVRVWMNAADCLLLPTYTEAVPTSVMEAFACGIPAITSNIGGCPEIVEQGNNGILIPPRNASSLYDAVVWMNHNPESRIKMGEQARKTVLDRYNHNKLTEKLISVHRSLIDSAE
ncbi:MAG: glycosyltransferase family 4 protein [Methanoregula sp.]|nr:glycosyltransferase family 4 protein [Methanoregula sp.]